MFRGCPERLGGVWGSLRCEEETASRICRAFSERLRSAAELPDALRYACPEKRWEVLFGVSG